MNSHSQHERARREAFGWYVGNPPSPDAARRHFFDLGRRYPEKRGLYDEALRIFLATCKVARQLS